jgi:hypothetical protein
LAANPVCGCHDVPQRWNKDPRYTAGGFWKCSVKGIAYQRDKYATDPLYRGRASVRNRRNERRFYGDVRRAKHAPANPKMAELLAVTRRG